MILKYVAVKYESVTNLLGYRYQITLTPKICINQKFNDRKLNKKVSFSMIMTKIKKIFEHYSNHFYV